ncbi:hypothetical protein AWB78_04484 [Caballeronia calidae]|uniref:Uncharacterized protein n=1 Tax=Caballeronia calidae TaxID=1777139 RepID=A0A158CX35_9BURK|nr:hypothetical protein [Caballeronia calidae]SAK86903.1 hypothetical protein AWB78_04484 [Caballeronia calidae]
MKALLVAGWLIASATALHVHAAIRYDELWFNKSMLLDYAAASATAPRQSVYDSLLVADGVDPQSGKGQLIIAWIRRINDDPVILGNPHSTSRLLLNSSARARQVTEGLERVSPGLRLQYVALISKFLDTLVPPDCFGSNDMTAVINRISLSAMSEADIDGYFHVLHAALHASVSAASLDSPSPEQYSRAEERLKLSILQELGYVPADVARYSAYATNPRGAAPADACWAMRVTLHAILAMPEPERDIVLRKTVRSQGVTR